MGGLGWLLLGVGFVTLMGGLVLPDRMRAPWNGLVAFLAPVGLFGALIGVLLICVPGFFDPPPAETSGQAGNIRESSASAETGSAVTSGPESSPATGVARPPSGASP